MTNLVVVFGHSGAGKSYFCDRVEEMLGYAAVHAIGHLKRDLERLYKLPYGTLDTQSGKSRQLPNTNITGQQLLEDLYHFWAARDPYYSTRGLRATLETFFRSNFDVVLNAVRNYAEAELINELRREFDLEVTVIWLYGAKSVEKSTDTLQQYLIDKVDSDDRCIWYNDYTPGTFDSFIEKNL